MLNEYKKHKTRIHSYFKGESIENLNDDDAGLVATKAGITIFLSILALIIALWVWGLVILLKYWSILPSWAQILGVLGLIGFVGPVLTVIVVYIGKSQFAGSGSNPSPFNSFRMRSGFPQANASSFRMCGASPPGSTSSFRMCGGDQ
jgi:hypothetical protein